MMIIKKIVLNIEKDNSNFIVLDGPTLTMLVGTSAANSNIHLYNIKKEKGKWIVPIETVKERIETLENRKKVIEEKLDIMKQIVGGKK